MDVKKPPDRIKNSDYKCIKKRLIKIINKQTYNNKDILETINDSVKRVNNIVTKTYMLLRLWILDKYHKKEQIPKLNDNLIRVAFNTFINTQGKKTNSSENKKLLDSFKLYYSVSLFGDLENGSKLSTILSYSAITMLTAIENNIRLNFTSYLNRFINSYFTKIYEKEIVNTQFKKELYSDLKTIKNDIINNTLESNDKYKEWILKERNLLVPILKPNESIIPDLCSNPQKYLKYMIYMTGELEKLEKSQFQFFPLQTNAIPRNIQIDNKALIELFETKVSDKLKNADKIKEILWLEIFKLDCKIKNYSFDYCIITDGYSTSLRFISKDGLIKKTEKIKKMQKGKLDREIKLKNLNKEDKNKLKLEINEIKNNNEIKNITNTKLKLSKVIKKEDIKKIKAEFPYIDDISKNELIGKHIFIDPGKRALFTMVDDNGKYLKYTNRQYMEETQRLQYSKKLEYIKNELEITKEEEKLNKFNSKTIELEKFKEYIKNKIQVNTLILKKYFDNRFRKYKWYSYINKKRAEDNLLNKITNAYSKDHIIIIGDWSIGKQMSNYISTPNIRLKRKLKEKFKVFNIDEFRTSCINYKTEELCNNLYLQFNNKNRKMHSILTYKMENKRLGCINRDKNGCNNIKKLFNCYLSSKEIPKAYSRKHKLLKKSSTAI